MTWSYSGDPSNSDLDQVRFLVQDTQESDQLLQDEEITFLLTLEGAPLKAASKAAETIGGMFARKCDEKVGTVSQAFSQKSSQYFELSKRLKRHSDVKQAETFAGGLDITQKETQEDNENRVQPDFTKELHDFDRDRDDRDRRGRC